MIKEQEKYSVCDVSRLQLRLPVECVPMDTIILNRQKSLHIINQICSPFKKAFSFTFCSLPFRHCNAPYRLQPLRPKSCAPFQKDS
jgi:hypothetical protein